MPSARPHGPSWVPNALLTALAVVSISLAVEVVLGPGQAPAASQREGGGPVRALIVGGWVTAGGDGSVAAQAAESLGWDSHIYDHPGVGLVTGSSQQTPPLARQAQLDATGFTGELVLVAAGASDLGRPPDEVSLATSHLVDRLRVTVPMSTQLLLLAPDGNGSPAVRAALAAVARDKKVHFLDPASWSAAQGATTTATVVPTATKQLSGYLAHLQVAHQ